MQAWHLFWRTSAEDCFCTAHKPLTVIYPFYFMFSTFITVTTQKQSSRGVLKKDVLRNFAKFTGKHLCQSLFFNKVAGLRRNFAKFLRTPFVTEHLWWLLLTTVDISDVCFWFKFKRLQIISIWYLIFTEVTSIGIIFFFHDFSVFLSFASFLLVAAHKKDTFKLRIH